MRKVLRSSTIIPAELYVQRSADRQLRRVLEEMGRPGYVLVARQMGKTNLLLNARRELQSSVDAFVYVDLSNPFSSARECFRNIVDTALESHPSIFSGLGAEISRMRQKDLPPHKEHEIELRELLRSLSGKLVIILDEVDALTNSAFSDQIFAQIRSTYFSRANLSEYERLTYVLSGVAEPSELIKNPKLSPFNIGEKIYLDDFNRDEYLNFLERSRLSFSSEVISHIFEWTNGNPRITWDVCSELEDILLSGSAIDTRIVDQVISKLYLTSYDRAPVDHIRTLAETTPEIRTALVELRYGKGSAISHSNKSKLYLAGIITSNGDNPRIKNKIIDLSLSEQWLRDLERKEFGLLKMAAEQLSRMHFRGAIDLYTEYLSRGRPSEDELLTVYTGLSSAHYSLGEYSLALDWLKKGRIDKSRMADLYFEQIYHEGLCCFHLNDYQKSIDCFGEVIDWGKNKKLYWESVFNLASSYYALDFVSYSDKIVQLFLRFINEIASVDSFSEKEKRSLGNLARYNLSEAYLRLNDSASAIRELEQALQQANSLVEQSVLSYKLATLIPQQERKIELLKSSVDAIIEGSLRPSKTPSDFNLNLTESILGGLLAATFELDENGSFEKIFKYCFHGESKDDAAAASMSSDLLMSVLVSKSPEAIRKFVVRLLDAASQIGDETTIFLYTKMIAFYSQKAEDFDGYALRYLDLLSKQSKVRSFDRLDVPIVASALASAISGGRLSDARRILSVADAHRAATPPEYFIQLDFYSMIASGLAGEKDAAQQYARHILKTLDSKKPIPLLSNAEIEGVRRQATSVIFPAHRAMSGAMGGSKGGRKYQRNDRVTVRYGNGRVVVRKYKNVERDLSTGLCVIVD